ncbi:hypothetical protein SKAU_G00282340 [Synaphobranchus kaupii]|uniref:DDE Tnp4 domain-containing protein n=1 Tax=Synaphobranchus kaupii TaxID=118154 RepID=A0A9Q1EXA3_SYNKA|nr:hypothetical protein SKAU_G00282340 [Synaphobranchus kaupii]
MVIGAIDCTHIPISAALGEHEGDFVNRKSFHSINVQTRPENKYNVALNKTRVRIEMTFGVIKSRFNCLRGLRVSPEWACQITDGCVVLHNITTIRKEKTPPVPFLPPDVVDPITLDHPTGRAVRQAITEHFFN